MASQKLVKHAALAIGLVFASATLAWSAENNPPSAPVPIQEFEKHQSEWLKKLDDAFSTNAQVEALIEFRQDEVPKDLSDQKSIERPASTDELRRQVSGSARSLVDYLAADGVTIIQIFSYQPLIRVRLTQDQAKRLADRTDVIAVHLEGYFGHEKAPVQNDPEEDILRRAAVVEELHTLDTNGHSYVNAELANARGYTGRGARVAILDDGIYRQHELLSQQIVAEACFSNSTGLGSSLCPGNSTTSTGTGAASQCTAQDAVCAHGSHVAGIAAGNNQKTGISAEKGIAPDAGIVAVQVFTRRTGTTVCEGDPSCIVASNFDIAAALDWVIGNAGSLNVAAVNLSLGGASLYTDYCDTESLLTPGINALRRINVLTVVATGNDGKVGSINAPACVRAAVAVSSVIITSPYSGANHSRLDALLAPGFLVRSAGTTSTVSYVYLTGTSMATPHVTGAIAILKAKLPNATADQILAAMQSSGISTTYTGWTWSTPLLDVNAAVDALGHAPAPSGVMLANLFSGANSTANLYLRLMNNDATIGHATITILQNSTPVNTLGTYNVTVPVNAALQISMKDIETAIGYSGSATSIFTGYIKADFKGFVQNVLYNPAAQALTNVTDCASLLTDDKRALGNVHTSLFSANYPGTIYINNTGSSDAKATLDMYEALTGTWLGSATTSTAVAAYTNTSINVVQWLDFVNFKPTTSQFHVVFKLRSGFSGFLQYLVSNVGSKVITDMTRKCAL